MPALQYDLRVDPTQAAGGKHFTLNTIRHTDHSNQAYNELQLNSSTQ